MTFPKRYIVQSYLECERCSLHKTRRSIVFGRGDLPADILFIGEAPGVTEDMLGLPFVGQSGKLLEKAMQRALELSSRDTMPRLFITNIVACRPCDFLGGPNRPPSGEESWACWQRLERTFKDVAPKRVVLLGKVAVQQAHKAFPDATCLPHPAFILRLGGVESPLFRSFVQDLSEVFKHV